MSRYRCFPLLAAFVCGLVPLIAKFAGVSANPLRHKACAEVASGCNQPGPTVNECRDQQTAGGTYTGATCEVIYMVPIWQCSLGIGDCELHSYGICAHAECYVAGASCGPGMVCVGDYAGGYDFDAPTCST